MHAALLARDQHLGTGGALGVGEGIVLLDDERPPQRDHHQDPHEPAHHREDRDAADVQVVSHEQDRGDREHDACRDGIRRRARGLDDVVLEDRGAAQRAEDRNRQDGDRDRGADGEADLQGEIDVRRAEDESQDDAEHERARRELRGRLSRWDVRLMVGHRRDNLTRGDTGRQRGGPRFTPPG